MKTYHHHPSVIIRNISKVSIINNSIYHQGQDRKEENFHTMLTNTLTQYISNAKVNFYVITVANGFSVIAKLCVPAERLGLRLNVSMFLHSVPT